MHIRVISKAILPALVVAVAALMAPFLAHAGVLDSAEAALRAGQPGQAQALLVGYQPQSNADQQRRDWVNALALIRQNQTEQAIPLLERLVADAPAETRMRLELARAYFVTGRDGASRRQFNAARAGQLAQGEAEAVDRFVAELDRRKTSESYFRFALVPESNAVRRTAADTITLNNNSFTLNNKAQSGTGIRLGFGHVFTPRLAPGWRGRFGAHVDGRLYSDQSITSSSVRLEAGAERSLRRDTTFGAGALAEVTGLAGRMYSTAAGGYLSYSTSVGRGGGNSAAGFGIFSARLELMDQRYPDYRFSNGLRSSLALNYRHAVSPRMALSAGVVLARANALAISERSRTQGITLGIDYAFDGGLVLGGTYARSKMQRDGAAGLFTAARQDDLAVLTLRAYHTDFQIGGFAPTLDITAERRKSNITLYEYKNIGASIGFTRRF